VVSRWCFTLHRWPEPRMYLSIHEALHPTSPRKLFLDFQDMYRLHGAPLLLPSCGRTGSLGPVIGPTVSQAGRYSRDYYGASALLCPIT
jgi:hypothetical protein